jgi:hypothetical protein
MPSLSQRSLEFCRLRVWRPSARSLNTHQRTLSDALSFPTSSFIFVFEGTLSRRLLFTGVQSYVGWRTVYVYPPT